MYRFNINNKLDVKGVICWRKTIDDTGKTFFVKQEITDDVSLYFESYKMRKNFYSCTDYVTGRSFGLTKNNDEYTHEPSAIRFDESHLSKSDDLLNELYSILRDEVKEEVYTNLFDDMFVYSYLCEKISKESNLTKIPIEMVLDAYAQFELEVINQGLEEIFIRKRKKTK